MVRLGGLGGLNTHGMPPTLAEGAEWPPLSSPASAAAAAAAAASPRYRRRRAVTTSDHKSCALIQSRLKLGDIM